MTKVASPPTAARGELTADSERANRLALPAILGLTLVLSACSLVYELLLAHSLAILAANTVVWFSVVTGLFLLGMGLGAARHERRADADDTPWRTLFRVELRLTLIGALAVPLVHAAHLVNAYAVEHAWPGATAGFFAVAFLLALSVGYLTGLELPLLMRLGAAARPGTAAESTVLGVDYVGALVGGLAFPLVLLPAMPAAQVGFTLAGVNLVVATVIALAAFDLRRADHVPGLVGMSLLGMGLLWAVRNGERVEQYLLRKYYYYPQATESLTGLFAPMDDLPPILRLRSPYQRIDLLQDVAPDFTTGLIPAHSDKLASEPEFPRDHILFLNGDFQTNTTFEEIYHEWFAHVPLMTRDEIPHTVLVMGGGDGFLIRELLKYDAVERIVHVDIDPRLPNLARRHPVLARVNDGAFDDPRVERVTQDGFQYARRATETFDAIYIDFPVAVDYDLAKLYSREFFHFVGDRLAPDGFAVFDATGISVATAPGGPEPQQIGGENPWPIYYHTLRQAGFRTVEPFLTTLEVDNEAAYEALAAMKVRVSASPEFVEALRLAETEDDRERLIRSGLRQVLVQHVYALQQGFILVSHDDVSWRWRDRDIPLHVLDEARFRLSFFVEFPKPRNLDASLVNSILRPTLPYQSVWSPRRPY